MKQKNYVAPSISERASRIRTSILAGSNVHIHITDVPYEDARQRTVAPTQGETNQTLTF
ncbi:MAG: hypothetical protein J6Y15_09330 [Bacteroidaceae bacterium]|nr:hypothetical protein [Bacteroidaceae bacterium]